MDVPVGRFSANVVSYDMMKSKYSKEELSAFQEYYGAPVDFLEGAYYIGNAEK